MPKIAISYRREDSLDVTGRIFDRLATQYGRESVFRDIDSIRPGTDFREHIKASLNASDLLLVVVGPRWLGTDPSGKTRIGSETDFVRFEVETALNKGIPVIPLLVGQADMPAADQLPASLRDFAFRHAVTISSGKDFDHHASVLIHDIDSLLAPPEAASTPPKPATPKPQSVSRPKAPSSQSAAPVPPPAATLTAAAAAEAAAQGIARKWARYCVATLLTASALLRLSWDFSGPGNLLSSEYTFRENPLLLIEGTLLAPATIVIAIALMLDKRWANICGVVVCLCTLASDIYFLTLGTPDSLGLIISIIFWFAVTAIALCFFGYRMRRGS